MQVISLGSEVQFPGSDAYFLYTIDQLHPCLFIIISFSHRSYIKMIQVHFKPGNADFTSELELYFSASQIS